MAYLDCSGTWTKTNKNVIKCNGSIISVEHSSLVSQVTEQVPPPFPELDVSEIAAIMAATTLFLAACFIGKQLYKMLTGTKTE